MFAHFDYRLLAHLKARGGETRCMVRSLRLLVHRPLASTPGEADGQLWSLNYSPGPQRSSEAVADQRASLESLKMSEEYIAMNYVAL